jgi:beta-N-acetylhexosaminidase
MIILARIFKLFLALSVALIAFYFRTPFLAGLRDLAFWSVLLISLGLILSESGKLKKNNGIQKNLIGFLILAIACLSFSTATGLQIKFHLTKQRVFNADSAILEKLGQHFILGYRDLTEVKNLVEKRAINGIFITVRNIKNKTKDEIQQEIKSLQDIRRRQGLPPLWISTDQEGGAVSRLSPPLTKLPQLSSIIAGAKDIEPKKDAVIQYANTQARELSELGINLNFAPVVDLNKGLINPNDKYSKIYQRAISADKDSVAQVALWYCQALEALGVKCTLKHFPGLGRVSEDTHLEKAELLTSLDELTRDDWVPFRVVLSQSQAFTMLGHAKLIAVDDKHPVSFSKQVVTGILRDAWGYDGILITDDFSMQAVYGSQDGLRSATVKAINAGVDLILIAYDKDLYYEAMDTLLKAEKIGGLDNDLLEKSKKRLKDRALSARHALI